MRYIDDLSPPYVRERRIVMTLGVGSSSPAANQSMVIDVDYSKTLPEGLILPLILEVQGPSQASYQRRVFSRAQPRSIVITPREGGRHNVTLREVAHNKWWGAVQFDVAGERILR